MDINKELERLIIQYEIDKPFPAYQKILKDRGYIIYPTDDVINEEQFFLKYKRDVNPHCDLSHAIYQERKKLKQAKSVRDIQNMIQRLIFMFIYIKDFVNTFQMLEIYVEKEYEDFERYQYFEKELKILFDKISKKLQDKKGIINYWVDALDYGWEKKMPYLNEISSESVHFENAYTFTNWTNYTMKNIMLAKKTIDDKLYKVKKISKNCELIKTLQKDNIGFCYCGYHSYSIEEGYYLKVKFCPYQPSTLVLWESLRDMLLANQEKMYLLHIISETHIPWVSPVYDGEYFNEVGYDYVEVHNSANAAEKRLQARLYIDKQLKFYDSLLSDATTRIYMSDHGDGFDKPQTYTDSHHVMMMVKDKRQKPLKISSYFSYVDYVKLIEKIIKNQQISNEIGGTYAIIQGVNYCEKEQILWCLNKERFREDFLMGYRCVVSKEECYILRVDGYERYYRGNDRINYINFSKYQNDIEKLRKLAGQEFPNVYEEEVFKYSRAIQQVIERYRKRIGKEEIGKTMIKEYVDNVPEGKCIAIRGGGTHTIQLLGVLADRCQRISYIVDEDSEENSILDIPIISPEELKEKMPDIVLISSFQYHKEYSEEIISLKMDCDIYDIYEELDKKGIHLEKEFYKSRYLDEDFEEITI